MASDRTRYQVFMKPDQRVLEAMVRLSQDQFFQEVMVWVFDSSKAETEQLMCKGDDVVRGHCQAMREFMDHVNSARETLAKQEQKEK